ncbi:uncharacterized protein LOC124808938 isoform X2 [Hydra vulgaris]|uniref:Uncharacterized protein LOC124808938 isoform X2 n=1 Tax=Hydra vulgaris TaxID=6087 RepID=A0ABM4BH72_HYDVU
MLQNIFCDKLYWKLMINSTKVTHSESETVKIGVDTQPVNLFLGVTDNIKKDAELINESVDTFHEKSNEYCRSFTVHGLSRALTGNLFEKLFWGLVMLFSLCIIVYGTSTLVIKYKRNDVYIQFYATEYSEADAPIFTICPYEVDKRGICNLTNNCLGNITLSPLFIPKNSSYSWHNDIISIVVDDYSKSSVKAGVQISDYIKKTFHNCVRLSINFFDTLSSTSNGIRVYTIYPENYLEIFVHDADEEYPFFQSKPIFIGSYESDDINIELKKYKRLKEPFASNCSQNLDSMIFPGKYSKLKCIESLKCINSFKVCGNSYGFCKEFLPKNIFDNNSSSVYGINNLTECLKLEYEKKYNHECALPCDENVYTVISSFTSNCAWLKDNAREIWIDYPTNPYYHVFKEAPLYPFIQFISECGGLLGFLTGSSLISFIEVIVFFSLIVLRKIVNIKSKKEE